MTPRERLEVPAEFLQEEGAKSTHEIQRQRWPIGDD